MKFTHRGKEVDLTFKDEYFESIAASGHFHEEEMLEYIANMGIKGTYLDIGANQGNHSVYFSKFTDADEVISFEPVLQNFNLLVDNVDRNRCRNVFCFDFGISDKEEILKVQRHNNGRLPCTYLVGAVDENNSADEFVQCDSIDDVLTESTHVGLMKIDIEGMELKAINGALGTIKRCKPVIFIEAWTDEEKAAIEAVLFPLGYTCTRRFNDAPTWLYECKK